MRATDPGRHGASRLRATARAVKLRARIIRSNLVSRRYCWQPSETDVSGQILARTRGQDAILVTIAFNKPQLIELQIEMLCRHFRDSFSLVIADNSSDPAARGEIQALCERNGVFYVSLPPNPAATGSASHGLAMNWVYHRILSRAPTEYFGFLDHDIFPIRSVSYRDTIREQRSYGHFQTAKDHLFYWPGLCFFSVDYFRPRGANFLPVMFGETYGDTGASNWLRHYRHLDVAAIRSFTLRDVWADHPERPYLKLDLGHKERLSHYVANAITLFDDDWVHLVNGSNWAAVDMDRKLCQLGDYLNRHQE